MKFNLSSKQTSKLSISTQLQNAIKLLQMSAVEINQEIQNIFESNPLIEKEDNCEEYEEDNCEEHYSHYKDYNLNENKSMVSVSDVIEKTAAEEDSLQQYLIWQIQLLNISEQDKKIAETIIDYINDDGYLIKDILDIFDDIYGGSDITIDELIAVQHLIQNLDPEGVGTNGIQESLVIQVQNSDLESNIINKTCLVINEFFKEYVDKNFKIIRRNLNISKEEIILIDKIIKKQNARPGSCVGRKEIYDYIIPDLKVIKKGSDWIIISNKLVSPDIKINEKYINISSLKISDEDKEYVKNNLQEAKSFIKNIKYRNDTLLSLAESILSNQIDFFNYGIEKVKPMNLNEVAKDINVHESTVSRLTNGKYIETPYGVFELKFFFSSSIINDFGDNFSSVSIKEKIKKIIHSEDKSNPFSDEKIVGLLSNENIKLARRTVTKYRESLNLMSSSKRKTK
ncbi:RNA polymerase factor sigma-54 [Gammaproteobacteria bacterium]|nr:RNA polymerase factor sigma-54 [Gammaproteobacteria bacterium]